MSCDMLQMLSSCDIRMEGYDKAAVMYVMLCIIYDIQAAVK